MTMDEVRQHAGKVFEKAGTVTGTVDLLIAELEADRQLARAWWKLLLPWCLRTLIRDRIRLARRGAWRSLGRESESIDSPHSEPIRAGRLTSRGMSAVVREGWGYWLLYRLSSVNKALGDALASDLRSELTLFNEHAQPLLARMKWIRLILARVPDDGKTTVADILNELDLAEIARSVKLTPKAVKVA